MNKTIIININSIVFHIEENAYEKLQGYLQEIEKHFAGSEDSREIIQDIEGRVAEMFSEKIQTGIKEVLNEEDVEQVIARMGRVSDFENEEEHASEEPKAAFADQQPNAPQNITKRLLRDPDARILGGVSSGLGYYFGIEANWVRFVFVLLTFFGGTGLIIYAVLWLVIPVAVTRGDKIEMRGDIANIEGFKRSFDSEIGNMAKGMQKGVSTIGKIIGKILRGVGNISGVLLIICLGVSLIGLIVFGIILLLALNNVVDVEVDPLNVFSKIQAVIIVVASFFAIGIPVFGLFFLLIRFIFNKKPMNNIVALPLLSVWIIAIGFVVYSTIIVAKDFSNSSTIVQDKPLTKSPVYYLEQNDIRVIHLDDKGQQNVQYKEDLMSVQNQTFLRNNIRLRFEKTDSLQQPYLHYEFSAKGATYKAASERASNIRYHIKENNANILFDSEFGIRNNDLIRDQEVTVTMYIPVGTKLFLSKDLRNKLSYIADLNCIYNDDTAKVIELIMGSDGLTCAKNMNDEATDNTTEASPEN